MQLLVHGQFLIKGRLFGQITDGFLGLSRLVEQIVAGDDDSSGIRSEHAGQHAQRGRFASAVGAEKSQDLASRKGEVKPIDHPMIAVPPGQPFNAQQLVASHVTIGSFR